MSYPVSIGEHSIREISNFISESNFSSVFILVDSNTRQFCLPLILAENKSLEQAFVIEIPAGELAKSMNNCEKILTFLLKKNADRQSVILNIGGGVVSDIGGFVASIYKRGINFINVPTTLLSMVDASIGGKTGINFQDKKNMIGTFSSPSSVFIHPAFLKTLSFKEIRSGYAEIFKHIILSDSYKFNSIINGPSEFPTEKNLIQLIDDSARFKYEVTNRDFLEKGNRKILNFGHTLGHALESYSLKGVRPLRHGEAIAAGMAGELYLSSKLAGFPENEMYSATHYLRNLYSDIQLKCNPEDLINFMYADKKNIRDKIGFSLLSAPGKPAGVFYPSHELILECLSFMIMEFSTAQVQ